MSIDIIRPSRIEDIFTLRKMKQQSTPRVYAVTWPCGGTWQFDRHDLDIPIYKDGEQTGISEVHTTLRSAIGRLKQLGCKVELIK